VTFAFKAPAMMPWVIVFLIVVTLLSLALGRRSAANRMIGFVVVAAIVTLMIARWISISRSTVTVDEAGIVSNVADDPDIPWSEIQGAVYFASLASSPYVPMRPQNFLTVIGSLNARFGRFTLPDGRTALVAIQNVSQAAVVITTRDGLYIFGPTDAAGLADAMAGRVPVSGR
jgi:hypothetical protein